MSDLDNLHLAGLFPPEIAKRLRAEAFRGRQIFHWLQQKTVLEFSEMSNLPGKLRAALEKEFGDPLPLVLVTARASQDGTEKFLFGLKDGLTVETVLIPEAKRQTICVSSQVGCALGCTFCATGQAGFRRNLSAAEIAAQMLWVQHHLEQKKLGITNVVFMGMGEPLANYEAVLRAIRLLNHPLGQNLGFRRFTVSTCGLAPQIRRLAEEGLPLNLAVSLHAANDKQRSWIMPINNRYPLAVLLEACKVYIAATKRRVSFEYALIEGFNDSAQQARELRDLVRDLLAHVNLIPINPVGGLRAPRGQSIGAFYRIVADGAVSVSIRKERGADIEAACGQLRQVEKRE